MSKLVYLGKIRVVSNITDVFQWGINLHKQNVLS